MGVATARGHLALLEVGLPINVGRLNIADALGVTGIQQEEVCRDDIVGLQFDEISQMDVAPLSWNKLSRVPAVTDQLINKLKGVELVGVSQFPW